MAEIAIVVTNEQRPDDRYQDGDILNAITDEVVAMTRLENMICHPREMGFTQYGTRPDGCLLELYLARICPFKFERVSATEVLRTNLDTLEPDLLGPTPNEAGERINVQEFLRRRLQHRSHSIFGAPGAERWYSGSKRRYTSATLDLAWADVEQHSNHRKADNLWFPWTETARRKYLILPTLPMRAEVASRAEGSEFHSMDGQPDYDPAIGPQLNWKRRVKMNWRELGFPIAATLDRAQVSDYRGIIEPQGSTGLIVKPRKSIWENREFLKPLGDNEFFVP